MSIINKLNNDCIYKNNIGFCIWTNNDVLLEPRQYCYKLHSYYTLCDNCSNIIKTINHNQYVDILIDNLNYII